MPVLHERKTAIDILEEEYKASYRRQCREDDILRNDKLSCSDRILLVILERLYPSVRERMVGILMWKLAREAGVSKETARAFLAAMQERGYMDYRSKLVVSMVEGKAEYKKEVSVQELAACKEPGTLNTKDAPARKEHRKKVKERLRCRFCKSENIKVKVVAICKDCGKEQ